MAASKITKSNLNIGAISETLKCSQSDMTQISSRNTFDLGRLCSHSNINKWAKYKPIHHSGLQILSESARTDRQGDGEYYGVMIRMNSMDMSSLHNVTFAYNRPKGGASSPYRLSDFINEGGTAGYNHLAKPSVYGSVSWQPQDKQLYLDGGELSDDIQVTFGTNVGDSLSIDFASLLGVAVSSLYPIVMVGDYAIALKVKNGLGGYAALPLSSEGLRVAGFHRDLPTSSSGGTSSSESGSGSLPSDFPTNTSEGKKAVTMSVGLIKEIVNTNLGYNLNNWTKVGGVMLSGFSIGVPSLNDDGLCGMAVTLVAKNYNKALKAVVVLASDTGFSVSCSIKYTDVSISDFVLSDDNKYTISVTMTQGDNNSAYSQVATAQVASSFFLISEFNFSSFGIYGSVTGPYTLNISVIGTYSGVKEQVGTGHFSAS
jgi:hypothetical protein